jgi:EAL domain-containing protein (putative c-di-GMP-specific phosphodiesterase class I)
MQPSESIATTSVRDGVELERGLREAVANEALTLSYQPLVRSGDGQVLGVEALLRWESQEFGKVSPGVFIPIAERTGLMVQIGRWVLRTAARQVAEWQSSGLVHNLSLHVNLSLQELQDPETPNVARKAIEAARLLPEQLCFEVTEKQLNAGGEQASRTLAGLVENGNRLVLDDFGIGSSIEILTLFPFEFAKIDRALITTDQQPEHWRRLLRGIGGLARSLGITLIAEGVEGEQEMVRVAALGFAHAQGYAFGKPESAGDLSKSFEGERAWLSDF